MLLGAYLWKEAVIKNGSERAQQKLICSFGIYVRERQSETAFDTTQLGVTR